jgi:hypothetical protein
MTDDAPNACLQGDDAAVRDNDAGRDHVPSPDCWCHPDEVEPGVFVHREAR